MRSISEMKDRAVFEMHTGGYLTALVGIQMTK